MPKPLRSFDSVLGVPNLRPHEQRRVDSANKLARFIAELLVFAMTFHCFISIENPLNSWMWAVIAHYVRETGNADLRLFYSSFIAVDFDNCRHGGHRPNKRTRFLCSNGALSTLAGLCPGNHHHEPYQIWSGQGGWKFDTAIESEYPAELCASIATLLVAHLHTTATFNQPEPRPALHQTKKSQALIPEYRKIVKLASPPEATRKLLSLSQGAKERENGASEHGVSFEKNGELQTFGIYNTPMQFMRLAKLCRHPIDEINAIPDILKVNIFELITKGLHNTSKRRLDFAKRLAQMRKELAPAEAELRLTLPPHARDVLEGKNILVMQKLLEESNFADLQVCELLKGVDPVGTATQSPLFEMKIQPATTSADLLASETWRKHRLGRTSWLNLSCPNCFGIRPRGHGVLEGPFNDLLSLKRHIGFDSVLNRRFVIQNGKPRVIDDLREGVNSAFTSLDRLRLHDADFISVLLQYTTNAVSSARDRSEGWASLQLQDGSKLEGWLHPDFQQDVGWTMKCFDLAKAYKQVPLSNEARRHAVLFLHHPQHQKPVYFASKALPFGASASVFAFTRISRAIWHLASHFSLMIGGVFFDDFPTIELQASNTLARMSFERLLKSLGWVFSQDAAKSLPFDADCDALGVRFSAVTRLLWI